MEKMKYGSGKVFEGEKTASLNKQDILLKGLEALGEYCSLGFEKQDFFDELRYLEAEAEYHGEGFDRIKKKENAILEIVRDLRLVDDIIQKYNYKKNALIQILLDIQIQLRWIPGHALRWVSKRLSIPLARIYGIANFYEALSLEPRGAHLIQICTGTACHVRGAAGLVDRVSSILGVEPGQTDSERLFSLETVHCLGCCALGPVMVVDGEYYTNPSTKQIQQIAASCKVSHEKGENYAQVELTRRLEKV